MITVSIPYFRPITPNCLDEEYTGGVELRGETVMLDLNFERDWIELHKLDPVKKMVGRLITMDEKNRAYLYKEFTDPDGAIVRYYLQHLLEHVWRPTLEKRIDFHNKTITPIDQLFKCLHLERVGFYPEKEEIIAVFDYCVDPRYSESVIAMHFNQRGELIEILMET